MRMLVSAVILLLSLASFAESSTESPIECSEGCTITTCGATQCSVYWFRGSSGKLIDRYPKEDPEVEPEDGPSEINCDESLCVVRTCADGQCTVFGFKDGEGIELGVMEESESRAHNWIEDFRDVLRDTKLDKKEK